jgi:hypothetical protein
MRATEDRPLRCRAFLLEPEVFQRLREGLLPSLRAREHGLAFFGEVFDRAVVAQNLEVARILSALPELEGTFTSPWNFAFRRLPVPDVCVRFPSRPGPINVIVVLDNEMSAELAIGSAPATY